MTQGRPGRLDFLPKKDRQKMWGRGLSWEGPIGSCSVTLVLFVAFNGCIMVHASYNFSLFFITSFYLLIIFVFVSL